MVSTSVYKKIPNLVLIHLGTNDIGHRVDTKTTVEKIWGCILAVREFRKAQDGRTPIILIAQTIPTTDAALNQRIDALNAEVVKTLHYPSAGLYVVDLNSEFTPATMVLDGVYPNQVGTSFHGWGLVFCHPGDSFSWQVHSL
jgi:lysophospholipase L1-like esterase